LANEDKPKPPIPEQKNETETIAKEENVETEENTLKGKDGKTMTKEKGLRPESPFHRRCRPAEPSREFVAKPIPANLLTSGSPVKTRINGKYDKKSRVATEYHNLTSAIIQSVSRIWAS